jgi:hypothetical protein
MNKKIIFVSLLSFTILLGVSGCAGKDLKSAPPAQQGAANSQTPPPTPPAQPSTPVDVNQVADKVNKLLDDKYPGDWQVTGTTLSKGKYTENNNFGIADAVESAYPGSMVSIFIGEERISSTVKNSQDGKRVLSGYPTPPAVGETFKSGKATLGQASMGSSIGSYQKVYLPFKAGDKTVAVMSISLR